MFKIFLKYLLFGKTYWIDFFKVFFKCIDIIKIKNTIKKFLYQNILI
jgi:hypothetical protein